MLLLRYIILRRKIAFALIVAAKELAKNKLRFYKNNGFM